MAAKGLGYERLDQLTMEVLLGRREVAISFSYRLSDAEAIGLSSSVRSDLSDSSVSSMNQEPN